jgi:hypothetical protein
VWIPHGSSDRRRRKRKMDITPYRFTCVCSCADGASLSLLSPLLFPAAIRVISPRRNETFVTCMQIIQFELDTPPTPLRALMLNLSLPPFPDTNVPSSSLEISTDSVLSPCRACEHVSHCTCDVSLTHDRRQVHFLSPGTLSFVLRTKISKLLSDLRLTHS